MGIQALSVLSNASGKMVGVMTVYHGNKDQHMCPMFGVGKLRNDYGLGFYITPEKELAKEWAYSVYSTGEGFVHTYELDLSGLCVLDLTKLHSIHWVAELLANRSLNFDGREALYDDVEHLLKRYKIDTSVYDVIVGYRADDSYFTYAVDFVTGAIYLDTLERALRLGHLGIQVCVKSEKAFAHLTHVKTEAVSQSYAARYKNRDFAARAEYGKYKREQRAHAVDRKRFRDFL